MGMVRYFIGLVALLTIFTSCETDFGLAGDYTEKALVYGLLNPNDNPNVGGDGHLFRIQKAFLGEESAFVMALESDSSYFPYENLTVELIEYNGTIETSWVLDTVMIANKDTGDPDDGTIDFFGPEQRLYKAEVNINANREYEIRLTKTGGLSDTVIADAVTSVIDVSSFRWDNPSENSPSAQKMDIYGTSGQYKNYTLRFRTAERAKQYEVWMRFHYREVVQGVETAKSIEWRVTTFELNGESEWQVQMPSEGIYTRIGSSLTAESNTIRKIGRADGVADDPLPFDGKTQDIDIFIRLAGEDLFDYIDINSPTNSGASQDKPVFTNVNNGLGVFSSRTTVEFEHIYLSSTAAQHLVDGTYTDGLNFVIDPD